VIGVWFHFFDNSYFLSKSDRKSYSFQKCRSKWACLEIPHISNPMAKLQWINKDVSKPLNQTWWTIMTFHWEAQTLTILEYNYKNGLPRLFQHNGRSRWLKKASAAVTNEERDQTRARKIFLHNFRGHTSMICRYTSNW